MFMCQMSPDGSQALGSWWVLCLGTEFLYVLLCSRAYGLWDPVQPGVLGISLSPPDLGQTSHYLRTYVPRTPTVSNNVVIPSGCGLSLPVLEICCDPRGVWPSCMRIHYALIPSFPLQCQMVMHTT